MRTRTFTSSASALLLLTASLVNAKHGVHDHLEVLHKRHSSNRLHAKSTAEDGELGVEIRGAPETTSQLLVEKRGGQCAFPSDAGLVAVAPGDANGGWAMSPDQPCQPGNYCPYACPPGQVSMQWDPSATTYSYPQSMRGGLFCDNSGNIQKPFPDKPYCQSTAGNIGVQNNAGGVVSFCQTVLPGNEAMLIPTSVTGSATLAMPDTSYWCGTAAHYYINPPGIGTDQACVWGTSSNPYGNWSPYVAGGNVDGSGNTFIKLGWNPVYLEPATPFRNQMPTWGVKIDCPNGGCNGLPCAIDPSQNGVNDMVGSASNGAGGGAFCVVTVEKGSTANFVVFNAGGDSSDSGSQSAASPSSTWAGGFGGHGGAGGQGGSGGAGGQFFQSSSNWDEATSTSASETATTSVVSTSDAWTSATGTSSSVPASTTVVATQASSSHSRLPTHSPYYSLFNQTSSTPTEWSSEAPGEATATPSGSGSNIQPSTLPAAGMAASVQTSMVGVLSGLVLYALATF